MYSYDWDPETGGLVLNTTPLQFSKEPRPVYARELDILGFDRHLGWSYPKNGEAPLLWAEANAYWYRGRKVVLSKGGSLHTAPELVSLESPEPDGSPLRPVDVPAMVEKNKTILDALVNETVKRVFNVWSEYREKVDVFYVAFSGGKDSVVLLDIVQRALPHDAFKVVFGDTGMEFPDTYAIVERASRWCKDSNIDFEVARSPISVDTSWSEFGPPATSIRWCCTVHKTTPQIQLLRSLLGKPDVLGFAFTGVRGDESLNRSLYEELNFGEKHSGQFAFHPLLHWNSAELFCHLLSARLPINEAYKKGITRAGCLLCPLAVESTEFLKNTNYPDEVGNLVSKIASTSRHREYTKTQMDNFVSSGFWKRRRSGSELNFGFDQFEIDHNGKDFVATISVPLINNWEQWLKTVGSVSQTPTGFSLAFEGREYKLDIERNDGQTRFFVENCSFSKQDLAFVSLLRGVIKKSIYCVRCGACAANCRRGCISMVNELAISNDCIHCHQCHDIFDSCLRYHSVKNTGTAGTGVKNIDCYNTFGFKAAWLRNFARLRADFWTQDADCVNKKQDSFLRFLRDANIVVGSKKTDRAKLTLSPFGEFILQSDCSSPSIWGLIVCELVYSPLFNWYVGNVERGAVYQPDHLKLLIASALENDNKGLKNRNVFDSIKTIMTETPIGEILGLGVCICDQKKTTAGIQRKLKSLERGSWTTPDPLVILYSLYKFAEAGQGGYYDFSLGSLMQEGVERDGVSPAQVFGIDRDTMEGLVKGLSVNHPEFVSGSFSLGLDNIRLNPEKRSTDVLALFH